MGATLDAMADGGGRFCFVLVVEGYEKLITDHHSMSAVLTAWGTTDWADAIPGLRFEGSIEQEIHPWSNQVPTSSMKFIITADAEDDSFGEAVFRSKPNFITRQTQPFPATLGGNTLEVQSNAGLPASGTIYVGPQRVEYASKSGTTALTINALKTGTLAPFATTSGGHTYPRPSEFTPDTITAHVVKIAPKVADTPPTWIGRWVGLWMHKLTGDTVCDKDDAEVLFAGKIIDIQDSGLATVIEAEDLRGVIRDTVIIQKQFTGHVKEGIRLYAGDYLRVVDGSDTSTLDIVTSGASGATEIDEGYYPLGDFISRLNQWVATEFDAGNLPGRWGFSLSQIEGMGLRFVVKREAIDGGQFFQTNNDHYFVFLGRGQGDQPVDRPGQDISYGGTVGAFSDPNTVVVFGQEPWRIKLTQPPVGQSIISPGRSFELEHVTGEWVENAEFLPHPYASYRDAGDDRGFLDIEGQICFAKHSSDIQFDDVIMGLTFGTIAKGSVGDARIGRRMSQLEPLVARQLLFIGGSFADIVTKLLASIDGDGVNHPDYDAFPFGAAIPWELLGQPWLDSVNSLEAAGDSESIVIYLNKPTRLWDILVSDVVLRFAFPIFKNGTLRLVSPRTPNASLAEWTFDESNKGAPAGQQNDLRTATRVTREFLRNVIKIEYDLNADPVCVINCLDPGSIAQYGQSEALTIRSRNAFSVFQATGSAINELAGSLISRVMPAFARPIKVFRRTISGALFSVAPGDIGVLTDDFARDPNTGTRGIVQRAVTVLRTLFDFGHEGGELSGEVDLMFSEEERIYPLCPTGEVDDTFSSGGFTSGWHAANKQLKLKQHAHSLSSDSTDVNHFASGDEVRVTEIDPSDPTSADDFADTLSAVTPGSDTVTLNSGFGSGGRPAFSSSKRYRVTYGAFSTVDSGQKLKASLADSVDGMILDTIDPNLYAEEAPVSAWTKNTGSEAFVNQVDATLADGRPLSAGLVRDLCRNVNALANHHTAYSLPFFSVTETWAFVSGNYQFLQMFRVPAPFSTPPAGSQRLVTVAARGKAGASGSLTIRVTISPNAPRGEDFTNQVVDYPYSRVEMTTSSTTSVEMTAETLAPVSGHGASYFVMVEGKTTGANSATYIGLSQFQLGPLEIIV